MTRVAESVPFRNSPRLRELFLYICEETLQGRTASLHERQIGCHIYHRPPDYNAAEDNIVRVEARKLRRRVEEYFNTSGRDERLVISIPTGAYVPVFTPRVPVASNVRRMPPQPWRLWLAAQSALIVSLALLCLWFWSRGRAGHHPSENASHLPVRNVLWTALFNDQQETTIVCADATLVLYQKLTGQRLSLKDYLSERYAADLLRIEGRSGARPLYSTPQYTGVADVFVVTRLLLLNSPYLGRTVVKSARNLQLADFKRGNFVMIGGPRAIPWEELFDKNLSFRSELDPKRQIHVIRINSPTRNERSQYENVIPATGHPGEQGKLYTIVALTPNLSYTGYALLIRGTTAEATDAAGDYLTNPVFISQLMKTVGFDGNSRLVPFEALLESTTLGGKASDTKVVAYRISPAAQSPATYEHE